MRRPLLFGLLLALAPAAALATGPFGGSVTGLALGPDGRSPRWAATDRGLFQHDGSRWHRAEGLAQRDLRAVVETSFGLLVAEHRRGLVGSEDGGRTWVPLDAGLRGRYGHRADDVRVLRVDPADRARVFLGAAGQGTFESRDGGRTWRLLLEGLESAPPPAFHPQALLPPAGSRPLLMGTDGLGLFRWDGSAWAATGEGLPQGMKTQGLAASAADPAHLALATRGQGLWESRDGGQSWKPLRQGAFGVVGAVSVGEGGAVLAHFPEEGLVVAQGGKAGRPAGLGEARVLDLAPRRGGGWLAGLAHDGVLELGPSGAEGAGLNAGLDATQVLSLVSGGQGDELWAGDANGMFHSSNGSASWEARDGGLLGAPAQQLLWHRGRLYLGTGGQGVFRWAPGEVAAGAGGTWEARSAGLGTSNTIFTLQPDSSGGRLYVGTEGGVLTWDGAEESLWQAVNQGLPGASVWLVAAHPTEPGTLWAAGAGTLFRSTDAGASWAPVVAAKPVALLAQGAGGLWVLEEQRLSRLSGGELRPVFAAPPGERLLCLTADGETLWVGGSGGLWAVADGAGRRVWAEAGVLSLLLSADGRLAAGTDGRGVVRFRVR